MPQISACPRYSLGKKAGLFSGAFGLKAAVDKMNLPGRRKYVDARSEMPEERIARVSGFWNGSVYSGRFPLKILRETPKTTAKDLSLRVTTSESLFTFGKL